MAGSDMRSLSAIFIDGAFGCSTEKLDIARSGSEQWFST
jgi:hypothetical protein